MELHEKKNRLIWKRMEQQSQETPEEQGRREELFKVIEKNLKQTNPKQHD